MEPVSTVRGITRLREYIPQLLSSLPLFASPGADDWDGLCRRILDDAQLHSGRAVVRADGSGRLRPVYDGFLAVVLRGRKTRQIREGTLPLRVGLTDASCLIGNLRYMIRLPGMKGWSENPEEAWKSGPVRKSGESGSPPLRRRRLRPPCWKNFCNRGATGSVNGKHRGKPGGRSAATPPGKKLTAIQCLRRNGADHGRANQ